MIISRYVLVQVNVMKSMIFNSTLLVSIFCSLVLGGWGNGIATPTSIPLNFEIEELLLDLSSLPSGWRMSEKLSYSTYDMGQEENRYIEFTTETFKSPTMHLVFLYQNEEDAKNFYNEHLSTHFRNVNRLTEWSPPSGFVYQSQVADQIRFGCADFQHPTEALVQYTECVVVGQYGRIISTFFTYISPTMTYADFENILKAIDERMAAHFKPS